MPRPEIGDPINFTNLRDPTDPSPAPGVVDEVLSETAINCTITLADSSTRQERNVNLADPAIDYFRFYEPEGLSLEL